MSIEPCSTSSPTTISVRRRRHDVGTGGVDSVVQGADLPHAAFVDQPRELPRRVAQQHAQVTHKLVDKAFAMHLQNKRASVPLPRINHSHL